MTSEQLNFVNEISRYIRKYSSQYGIKVNSPIIAQAILESNWGKSGLSKNYHNYFGMKCGSSWKGKSVNMKTKEEYSVGTLTSISANFRAYDNMEQGVKGYFDFINTKRYSGLKGITDPELYLVTIKNAGYATSSTYVKNLMNVINKNQLTTHDNEIEISVPNPDSIVVDVDGADIYLLASDTIRGKYGSGEVRKQLLGDLYVDVQSVVNQMIKISKSSDSVLANEVIKGKLGVGDVRKKLLGSRYDAVQKLVNRRLA